jgi:hypothetical protein
MIADCDIIFVLFYRDSLNHAYDKQTAGLYEDEEDVFEFELRACFDSGKKIIPVILDMQINDLQYEVKQAAELKSFGMKKYTTDNILRILQKKVIVLSSLDFYQLKLKF